MYGFVFQKLCLSSVYWHTCIKCFCFLQAFLSSTAHRWCAWNLVLSWPEENHRDSWLNLWAENREQPELFIAPYISALVINKTGGLFGLPHDESPVLNTPSFHPNCSSVISSSRTDEIQWCVHVQSSFYDEKVPVKTTHSLISSPTFPSHGCSCNTLGEPVYWQLYLVSLTLAFHLAEWSQ